MRDAARPVIPRLRRSGPRLPVYGPFGLTRLEDLILRQVFGDFFALHIENPDDA